MIYARFHLLIQFPYVWCFVHYVVSFYWGSHPGMALLSNPFGVLHWKCFHLIATCIHHRDEHMVNSNGRVKLLQSFLAQSMNASDRNNTKSISNLDIEKHYVIFFIYILLFERDDYVWMVALCTVLKVAQFNEQIRHFSSTIDSFCSLNRPQIWDL